MEEILVALYKDLVPISKAPFSGPRNLHHHSRPPILTLSTSVSWENTSKHQILREQPQHKEGSGV